MPINHQTTPRQRLVIEIYACNAIFAALMLHTVQNNGTNVNIMPVFELKLYGKLSGFSVVDPCLRGIAYKMNTKLPTLREGEINECVIVIQNLPGEIIKCGP